MIENFEGVGERISEKLNALKLKQKNLCEMTEISKNAMSNYINGKRIPDTLSIYKIASALNISIEWLLTGQYYNLEIEETEVPLGITDELLEKFDQLDTRDKNDIIDIIEMKYERIKSKQKSYTSNNTEKQSKSANEIA